MSADGDIIRNEFKHVGISQPAAAALARLEAAAQENERLVERGQNLVDAIGMERELREAASEECREWQDAARTWQDNYQAAEAKRDALAEALRKIVQKHIEAWQDVDDLDDTGAHVGVAHHAREQAGGLGIAAEIARAALAEAGLE